ncbi:MAG: hypothetical protein QHC90_08070 [Shinella sp.]|nr:hypothetical protein [Shinella sp.]
MRDTGPKARGRMIVFVLVILMIALAIAAYYLFGNTPGEVSG